MAEGCRPGFPANPSVEVILGSTGMVDLPPSSGGGVEAYVWDIARVLGGLLRIARSDRPVSRLS